MAWFQVLLTAIVVGVLSHIEVNENKWVSSKSVTLNAPINEVFDFVMNAKNSEKWLHLFSRVEEADDSPLGVGKKLNAVLKIPYYGDYKLGCHISEVQKLKRVFIESDCLCKFQVGLDFARIKKDESKLTVTISHKRLSYFYQYTIAPLGYYLDNWELERVLTSLQSQFPEKKEPGQKESAKKEPRKKEPIKKDPGKQA